MKDGWPNVVLRPGETYRHSMVHRFQTINRGTPPAAPVAPVAPVAPQAPAPTSSSTPPAAK
jgi:hypothetical protein